VRFITFFVRVCVSVFDSEAWFFLDSKKDWRPTIFVLVLFLISYGLVWAVGSLVLHKWDSPMHFLVPIPAFFLAFWLFNWIEKEFAIPEKSAVWPIGIMVLGFAGFFVAQLLYWCNGLTDISATKTSCSSDGMSKAMELIGGQWSELLFRDAFFYFLLMVLLAWIGRFIVLSAIPQGHSGSHRKTKTVVSKT